MATLGMLVLAALNFIVFVYIPPLGIVLPLVLTLSNGAFMSTYAAYYKIKEIMIDPYYNEDGTPKTKRTSWTLLRTPERVHSIKYRQRIKRRNYKKQFDYSKTT